MATLNLIDTKLTLKFSEQSYSNSNINNAASDQTIYDLAELMEKYQLSAPTEIGKTLKYEFIIS
jgi:hypothetical protein